MSDHKTRWSMVVAAGSGAPAALEWLCRQYWDVLCAHAQRRGAPDPADAVQDFLAHVIERSALAQADPQRGRFRAWLFTCLDHFLANRYAAALAHKRGGGQVPRVLDETLPLPAVDVVAEFDRDWALMVFARAMAALQREASDQQRFTCLQPWLLQAGNAAEYRALGVRLQVSETAVKVAIHRLRARLNELIRTEIGDSLAEQDPQVIEQELDHLLGVLSRTPGM